MFDIDQISLFGKIKNSILELQFGLIQIQLALQTPTRQTDLQNDNC